MSSDHIDTVSRYVAAGNARDYAALDALRTSDFIAHVPSNGAIAQSDPIDAATLNRDLRMITTAFPDLHNAIHDVVAAGDRVAVRAQLTGTFTAPLGAVAPTGARIAWDSVHFYRIADGTIAEAWFVTDTLNLLRQAGAVSMLVGPS